MYTCMCLCKYVYMRVCMYVCMCMCVCMCMYVYVCMYVYEHKSRDSAVGIATAYSPIYMGVSTKRSKAPDK
jgi:hypothetical protein